MLEVMHSFDFVSSLHLMRKIMGVTNNLSKALQRKDQDIVNAMTLVKICKQWLQVMRESGCESFFDQLSIFCEKHEVDVPNMDAIFTSPGRALRKAQEIKTLHHFCVDLFFYVIDVELQELNNHFTKVNT